MHCQRAVRTATRATKTAATQPRNRTRNCYPRVYNGVLFSSRHIYIYLSWHKFIEKLIGTNKNSDKHAFHRISRTTFKPISIILGSIIYLDHVLEWSFRADTNASLKICQIDGTWWNVATYPINSIFVYLIRIRNWKKVKIDFCTIRAFVENTSKD